LRPFPGEDFYQALKGKKGVAVIDQNLSMGKGGILHSELASVLYGRAETPPILASFIGGLGGRDILMEEFFEMAKQLKEAYEEGRQLQPRLMYTNAEMKELRSLQIQAQTIEDPEDQNRDEKEVGHGN